MAVQYVTASMWEKIEPLLPREHISEGMSNRHALDAIIYVLTENVGWLTLDRKDWEYHGSSIWRRLRRWQDLGVWDQVSPILISELPGLDEPAKERVRTGRRGMDARHYRGWSRKPQHSS